MTILLILLGYLMGGIPTGKLVVKKAKGLDIQSRGSGNIGAANVYRVAGPSASTLVLLIDTFKGLLPVLIARKTSNSSLVHAVVGIAVVAGHIWPALRGFKGGKGVVTNLGALLALAPVPGIIAALTGGSVMAKFRISSLGSLSGTAVGALFLLFAVLIGKKPTAYLLQALVPTAIIFYAHRENFQRLMEGTENKLEFDPEE